VAAEQNAQGAVVIAEAKQKTATINLGYTTIIAPPREGIAYGSVKPRLHCTFPRTAKAGPKRKAADEAC
jgi:hypothetical protein